MKVITLANQKGGCGKTTTAQTLAIGLVNHGYRVLVIDCDAQCNLSSVFGLMSEKRTKGTLLDVMQQDMTISECVASVRIGLDVLACNPKLSDADKMFSDFEDIMILNDALEKVKNSYDYVVIDTPPAVNTLTTSALMTSDYLIVPMTADYFSIQGFNLLERKITTLKRMGSNIEILGILLTRCDRTSLTSTLKESITEIARELNTTIFESTIRQGVAIRESQLLQSDIFSESPKAAVTQDYNAFINECIERMSERK